MTQNSEMWSKSTKTIFTGVLLFAIAGLLYPVFSYIKSVTGTIAGVANLGAKLAGVKPAVDFSGIAIITYLLLICIIVGYYLYLKGLTDFATVLEPTDAESIKKVRTGTLLVLIGFGVAFLFGFVPFMGWFGKWVYFILCIIGYILMLLGFSALKGSTTFEEVAKKGAGLLFIALILLLVAAVINLIPFIGGILNMIICVAAYVLVFMGWSKIKGAVTFY
jgi:hypothetical protein